MTPRITILLAIILCSTPAAWSASGKAVPAKKSAKKSVSLAQLVGHVFQQGADFTLTEAANKEVGISKDIGVKTLKLIKTVPGRETQSVLYVVPRIVDAKPVADFLVWEMAATITKDKASTYDTWVFRSDLEGNLTSAARGLGGDSDFEQKVAPVDDKSQKAFEVLKKDLLNAGLSNLK